MSENILGVALYVSATANAPATTAVPNLTDIKLPSITFKTFDDSTLDQRNQDNSVDYEEHFGLARTNPGELITTHKRADALVAIAAFCDREDHYLEVRFDDGSKQPYVARLLDQKPNDPAEDRRTIELTWKIQKTLPLA